MVRKWETLRSLKASFSWNMWYKPLYKTPVWLFILLFKGIWVIQNSASLFHRQKCQKRINIWKQSRSFDLDSFDSFSWELPSTNLTWSKEGCGDKGGLKIVTKLVEFLKNRLQRNKKNKLHSFWEYANKSIVLFTIVLRFRWQGVGS